MSVYVDNARNPLVQRGFRMLMSHMVADSSGELHLMAQRLGLSLSYIQHPGEPDEHLDVSQAKRAEALRHGAIPVSQRELVQFIRTRRARREGGHG